MCYQIHPAPPVGIWAGMADWQLTEKMSWCCGMLNAVGYKGWHHGKITKYDEIKKAHTIQWQDGSDDADCVVDLMSCKN